VADALPDTWQVVGHSVQLIAEVVILRDGSSTTWGVFELCLYEMDAPGTWLDGSTVTFEQLPGGQESVHFAGRAKSTGMSITKEIGDDLREHGWMQVTRVPVAPAFGLGYPVVKLPDGRTYEMVGVPDRHVAKLVL
jgi:hypothetical protein